MKQILLCIHFKTKQDGKGREKEKVKIIKPKQVGLIENSNMASFQAKVGWKRPRQRENKNSRSNPFLPDAKQKIPKKLQKNRLEKEEKEIK